MHGHILYVIFLSQHKVSKDVDRNLYSIDINSICDSWLFYYIRDETVCKQSHLGMPVIQVRLSSTSTKV